MDVSVSGLAQNVIVDFEIHDQMGNKLFQTWREG